MKPAKTFSCKNIKLCSFKLRYFKLDKSSKMFSGRIILNGFKKVLDIAIDTLKQRVPDIKNLIADFTSSNKHLTGGSSRKKKTK